MILTFEVDDVGKTQFDVVVDDKYYKFFTNEAYEGCNIDLLQWD